MPNEKLEHHV